MAKTFLKVDAAFMRNIVKAVGAGQEVFAKPFADDRFDEAVRILRFGPRGFEQQFEDSTEYRDRTSTPWAPTKPFGNRPAPAKTMVGTGAYRSGWLGRGPGGYVNRKDNQITVGVQKTIFPQVLIHQSTKPYTIVKPKKRTASGDWAMCWKLGLTFGVWLSNKRLERGLKIVRRKLSVSFPVKQLIAKTINDGVRRAMKLKVAARRVDRG